MAKTRPFMDEVFNKGNMKGADEFMSAGFVEHDPFPSQGPGVEGFKQGISVFRQAFPDLQILVDDIFADGEKVVAGPKWAKLQLTHHFTKAHSKSSSHLENSVAELAHIQNVKGRRSLAR